MKGSRTWFISAILSSIDNPLEFKVKNDKKEKGYVYLDRNNSILGLIGENFGRRRTGFTRSI